MEELLLVAVVMATPVFLLAELRRMLSGFLLNRTIQKALETAPEQIPLLTERLEQKKPRAVSATGLAAAVIGGAYSASLPFAETAVEPTTLGVGIGVTLFGIVLSVTRWVEARRSRADDAATASHDLTSQPVTDPLRVDQSERTG